jgi:hypothetical protein
MLFSLHIHSTHSFTIHDNLIPFVISCRTVSSDRCRSKKHAFLEFKKILNQLGDTFFCQPKYLLWRIGKFFILSVSYSIFFSPDHATHVLPGVRKVLPRFFQLDKRERETVVRPLVPREAISAARRSLPTSRILQHKT